MRLACRCATLIELTRHWCCIERLPTGMAVHTTLLCAQRLWTQHVLQGSAACTDARSTGDRQHRHVTTARCAQHGTACTDTRRDGGCAHRHVAAARYAPTFPCWPTCTRAPCMIALQTGVMPLQPRHPSFVHQTSHVSPRCMGVSCESMIAAAEHLQRCCGTESALAPCLLPCNLRSLQHANVNAGRRMTRRSERATLAWPGHPNSTERTLSLHRACFAFPPPISLPLSHPHTVTHTEMMRPLDRPHVDPCATVATDYLATDPCASLASAPRPVGPTQATLKPVLPVLPVLPDELWLRMLTFAPAHA